jgi:hypothetical protein
MKYLPARYLMLLSMTFMSGLWGCAALQEVAALRQVEFDLDRVGTIELAGVNISRIQNYQDIGMLDTGRLIAAIASGKIPLSFNLFVKAENPANNSVPARLVGLDWTLFLQDKETISGKFNDEIVLQPGQPQDIPVNVNLDLFQFFEGGAQDLVNLALALTGKSGSPQNIRLQAVPTVQTPIGPIRYPKPLTLVSRTVGE